MSPLPLIERQRAYTRIGEIRCGDEKTGNKPGAKLDTFRVTSQAKDILERVAQLYGGTIKPWKSPSGDAWQVVTQTNALPCMVIPGYSLKRNYELWAGPSKRERMCDGEEEFISGTPCICNREGNDKCKLLTRLMVLLPETGTSLGWQVSSTGETAADELDLAMLLAEGIANGRTFVPARLRLTQRRGQLNGQATRFVVPVLDLDPPEQRNLGAGQPALPPGYTPIERNPDAPLSLEEGLRVAEAQVLAKPPRVSLPEDDVEDDVSPVFTQRQVEASVERLMTGRGLNYDQVRGQTELGAEPAMGSGSSPAGDTDTATVESAPAPRDVIAKAFDVPVEVLDVGVESAPAQPELADEGDTQLAASPSSGPTIRQREGLERSHVAGNSIAASTSDKPITAAQAKKLDVLVGKLRDNGHIKTEHLYVKVAVLRNLKTPDGNLDVETLIALVEDARDSDGWLHWAPLRATLTRGEANQLIDALEEYAGKVGAR